LDNIKCAVFEIFACEKYRESVILKPVLVGHLVIGIPITSFIYDFLLMFNSNYDSILTGFQFLTYLIWKYSVTLKSWPSMSSRLVPFHSMPSFLLTIFKSPIVTLSQSAPFFEIFTLDKYRDLETRVRVNGGHTDIPSRSVLYEQLIWQQTFAFFKLNHHMRSFEPKT